MKIYLSASNQFDNLYNYGNHTEGEVCHLIAQKVYDFLKPHHDVKLGGLRDTMSNKVKESNLFGSDYYICIHTNAGGGEGTEVFCYPSRLNDKYVQSVYKSVASLTPTNDRGIKTNTTFYEIKNTNAICIYIECEFHDTHGDWIYNNVDQIAFAIASAFLNEEQKKTLTKVDLTDSTNLWKVQLGAFTTKERAENYAKELNEKYGISTYITH